MKVNKLPINLDFVSLNSGRTSEKTAAAKIIYEDYSRDLERVQFLVDSVPAFKDIPTNDGIELKFAGKVLEYPLPLPLREIVDRMMVRNSQEKHTL